MAQEKQKLSVVFAGDLSTRQISGRLDENSSRQILSAIQPHLAGADLRLVNLENPLFSGGEKIAVARQGPDLAGQAEDTVLLQAGAFDCVVLANNHLGDFGQPGVKKTLAALRRAGLAYVGGGKDLAEAHRPWLVTRKGIRLAVLAVAENEFGGAGEEKAGSAAFSLLGLKRSIQAARARADHVLVAFHGGHEYSPLPSPGTVERYRFIIDCGASAVVGMHPHCPQGWEIYRGCPIVYSTGNFLFHSSRQEADSSWYYGYLARLELGPDGLFCLEPVPYRFDPDCSTITPFTGKDKERMLAYLAMISGPIQDERLLADYFKGWCMISGVHYIKRLQFKDEYLSDPATAENKQFLFMRNVFTCEAHNELLTATLRLIEEGELELGRQMAEKIRLWQKMPL